MTERQKFIDYCHEFYGPQGLYPMFSADRRKHASKYNIGLAFKVLRDSGADIAFDSIDREKVRDILIRDFGLVFPSAPLTGGLDGSLIAYQ